MLKKIFNFITCHRFDKELIREILSSPINARGVYKNNPLYFYNERWYVLNEKCNLILKNNFSYKLNTCG